MSAAALSPNKSQAQARTVGLRPVRLRQDLGAVADLIELAFGPTMDAGGRAAVREMRTLSRSGPILWFIAGLDSAVQALMRGFVWIDPNTGRLIGNVSIYPAGYDNLWVIANVAVHPDFRRRGIAEEMMRASLDFANEQKASAVTLQVEADNDSAQRLYQKLGFSTLRGFTRWRRHPYIDPPPPLTQMPNITYLTSREWRAELALAEQLRPDSRGGMTWLHPTQPREFRPTFSFGQIFGMRRLERWVVRDPQNDQHLLATLRTDSRFGSTYTRTDLLVAPEYQGELEWPLLNFAIRYASDQRRGLLIEHPSDDENATLAFDENRFEPVRRLIHMLWTPAQK
ncbi:MAG: N-acetyltransferase [Chloroflexi bacterium]|nr:N-acetyltransferase [Chloroflexota bacterium]